MQRKSCKTLLTICNFQKNCERALTKRPSVIANCELQMANSNPVEYLENEKSFFNEIKSKFYSFW